MRKGPQANETIAAERRLSMSRRNFLRGVGACVAIPTLPSLVPRVARAAGAVSAPVRMAFITIPNGVNQDCWWPSGDDKDFKLGPTMEPLAALKSHIQVISGLDHINATAGNDGAGDHARANASLLTGCRAKKTSGADIHLGPSIDQVAAQHIGHRTRFPSLELTCDDVRTSGDCDSGYSCAYQYNVSWRTATSPMPPEQNPRLVFERLFGAGTREERTRNLSIRQQSHRSILDFIRDDARSLSAKLSRQDGRKLDEYLTSVRAIEERLARLEQSGSTPNPDYDTPKGMPDTFEEHMQLMYDMIVLAFQTDSTRIATMILSHDGSNRTFPKIDIARAHHDLSHHQGKAENLEMLARIDKHHMTYFAEFLQKLADAEDADGKSLLDNSMIVYTGGNADGNAHSHVNLPVILAGRGGGKLKSGRFLKLGSLPMCNMYLEMMEHMGVEGIEQFGDATNRRVNV
jgi:hypothetical protein